MDTKQVFLTSALVMAGALTVNPLAAAPLPTGGDEVRTNGLYLVHIFRSSGAFTVPKGIDADILLVGGGGGGGAGTTGGGGGGGGGVVFKEAQSLAAGTYEITVGEGGAGAHLTGDVVADGAPITPAENGGDTVFFREDLGVTITAHGGGAGGSNEKVTRVSASTASETGKDGGCGGGGASTYSISAEVTNLGGAGALGEGFSGGASTNCTTTSGAQGHNHCWAGGGGGAGEPGGNGVCTKCEGTGQNTTGAAGKGGDGLPVSITGRSVCYGGGGGGGEADYMPGRDGGDGGDGGGGAGGASRSTISAEPGKDGTNGFGGGGGGGAGFGANFVEKGGNGGSGVVIVRCKVKGPGIVLIVR